MFQEWNRSGRVPIQEQNLPTNEIKWGRESQKIGSGDNPKVNTSKIPSAGDHQIVVPFSELMIFLHFYENI